MDLNLVLPELRVPARRAQTNLPRWLLRKLVTVIPVPRSQEVDVHVSRVGGKKVRVYRPRNRVDTAASLLWVHGGGLLFGDARQDEALCLSTAERLGITIVSANYRFAPEFPFPAAHEDIYVAWVWMQEHAEILGIDPTRIAIGGESAGGGLVAGVVQRVRDEGGNQPVAQWLFAPMLDDRTAADHSLDAGQHLVWDNEKNREAWSGYLGTSPGGQDTPKYAAPGRRTDLAGLPPTYITYGDIELFAAENQAYADALTASGVSVTVDVVIGAPHGFENWAKDTDVAQDLILRAQDWLRSQ